MISFALGFSRRSMNLCTQAGEWKSSSLFTVCLIALFTAALILFIASLFIAVSALFFATFSALSTTLSRASVWACCFFCLYHLSKPDSVLLLVTVVGLGVALLPDALTGTYSSLGLTTAFLV